MREPFYVGDCRCVWRYYILPRPLTALKGKFHGYAGMGRGWLIRRKCWHGATWWQKPEEVKEFWDKRTRN